MSIIQEALKKAQSLTSRNSASPQQQKDRAAVPGRSLGSMPLLVIILIGVAAFAIIKYKSDVFAFIKNFQKKGKEVVDVKSYQEVTYKPLVQKTADQAVPQKPAAVVQKPVETVRPVRPDLVLNGIMYLNTGSQAIINNSVVSEGDTVSGARIVKINKNNVVLNFQDLEITLTLKK